MMTTGPVEEPTRAIEIERKYDVSRSAELPDLAVLPDVARVGALERRSLDAVYLDTIDGALARHAVAVRRRTGGADEGWHIKFGEPERRHEWGWPLAADSEPSDAVAVPVEVRRALVRWCGAAALFPIARVCNARGAIVLRNASEQMVAEFVDDHVTATDLRSGAVSTWREWEVELGPAAPAGESAREAFFSAADAAISLVGGVRSTSGSKLERALRR